MRLSQRLLLFLSATMTPTSTDTKLTIFISRLAHKILTLLVCKIKGKICKVLIIEKYMLQVCWCWINTVTANGHFHFLVPVNLISCLLLSYTGTQLYPCILQVNFSILVWIFNERMFFSGSQELCICGPECTKDCGLLWVQQA